ncbi:MAG: hypothetical protein ACLFV3_06180 [Phycisphaeraceae bacterium]
MNRLTRLRTMTRLTLLMLVAAVTLASAAPARAQMEQAIQQVPQNAEVVIVVPSLAQLNQKIATLQQELNIPIAEMGDVLAEFKQKAGIDGGLDDEGSLIFAISNLPAAMQQQGEPSYLTLLPVSDYDAFLEAFDGLQPVEDGEGMMNGDRDMFVRQAGAFALISNDQQAVQQYQAVDDASQILESLGTLGRRYFEDADAAVYVDVEALAPALKQMLEQGMALFEQQTAQPGMAQQQEMALAMMQGYNEFIRTSLDSTTAAVVTLDITDQGVGITQAFDYREDSGLAELLPGSDQGAQTILDALPDQPYLFAAGVDTRALDLPAMLDTLFGNLSEEQAGFLAMNMQASQELLENADGVASAWYPPAAGGMAMGGIPFNVINVYQVEDGQQFVDQIQTYVTELNNQTVSLGPTMPGMGQQNQQGGPSMTFRTSYTENAATIDGVEVDQYSFRVQLPPEAMQQMGPAAGFLGGMLNYQGYVVALDHHAIQTTGTDLQLLKAAVAAAQDQKGLGSQQAIQQIREQALPNNPALETYVSFDGIARMANNFMPMMGMPAIEVPENLPPVAYGGAIEDSSLAVRFYVPLDTAKFVRETIQQFQGPAGQPGQPVQPGQQPQGNEPPPYF